VLSYSHRNHHACRLAIELKALAVLLILLHSDEPDVVIYALCAIQAVTENCHPAQQFVAQYKGLLPFVRICSGNWGDCKDDDNEADASATAAARPGYFATANAAACKTVRVIVDRHTENRHLAHNVKLIPHLVKILLNGDPEEKKSAVLMFSDLLKHNTDNRDAMVSFGGVEALTVICRCACIGLAAAAPNCCCFPRYISLTLSSPLTTPADADWEITS